MLTNPEKIPYDTLKAQITNLSPENQLIPALAYGSGARVSELNQIKKSDIIIEGEYLTVTCKVLKKRKAFNVYRRALIRLDETWIVQPIINKINSLSNPDARLIPYSRKTVFIKLKKLTGINPHGFRKLRATHLVQKYGFNAHQLKKFFDWSSIVPSDFYVKLNLDDIKY